MTDRLTVGEIGERALIARLSPWCRTGAANDDSFGVGDDCASIATEANCRTVITKDLLIEGTHFLSNPDTDWYLVGQKAAGANISDLAAAGSIPKALFIGIGLPSDFLVEDVEALYRGMQDMAVPHGAEIYGGDTTRAAHLVISVTAVGTRPSEWANCSRADAAAGDFVYVTGNLGASRAGLRLVLAPDDKRLIDAETATTLLRRHFAPEPRVTVGQALAAHTERAAVIDISDSLHNEATLVAAASGVCLELHLEHIPVHPAAAAWSTAIGADPASYALFSGEEYELLFTSPATLEELQEIFCAAAVNCPITRLGTVKPGSGVTVLRGGNPVDPSDETFVHF